MHPSCVTGATEQLATEPHFLISNLVFFLLKRMINLLKIKNSHSKPITPALHLTQIETLDIFK